MIERISTSHAHPAFDAYQPQAPGAAGKTRSHDATAGPLKSIEFGQPARAPTDPARTQTDPIPLSLKTDTPPAAPASNRPTESYAFLDDSKHSSPKALKKWETLLGDLPPAEYERLNINTDNTPMLSAT